MCQLGQLHDRNCSTVVIIGHLCSNSNLQGYQSRPFIVQGPFVSAIPFGFPRRSACLPLPQARSHSRALAVLNIQGSRRGRTRTHFYIIIDGMLYCNHSTLAVFHRATMSQSCLQHNSVVTCHRNQTFVYTTVKAWSPTRMETVNHERVKQMTLFDSDIH